jgi:hypothetical protein
MPDALKETLALEAESFKRDHREAANSAGEHCRAEDLLTFDYSPEQWAEIIRSLQCLQAKPEAIEMARELLRECARSYFHEMVKSKGRKQKEKWRKQRWARIDRVSKTLIDDLHWVEQDFRSTLPPPPGHEYKNRYHNDLLAVMKINAMAKRHLPIVDIDSMPQAKPKALYQFAVLALWTKLGGKLKVSRHPTIGEIKGPLVRYFHAVTYPVHQGSPESLPDIIKRYVAYEAAEAEGDAPSFVEMARAVVAIGVTKRL